MSQDWIVAGQDRHVPRSMSGDLVFRPETGGPSGCLSGQSGHVSTDYEVVSAANGRTMILTRETRACNPPGL